MRRRPLRLIAALLLVLLGGLLTLRTSRPASAAGPYAYIASMNSQVFVIDTSTNTIVKTIDTGQGANFEPGVAVAPGGGRIYVTGGNSSNTVAVIDGASNTVITLIPVGSVPAGVAVSPDGSRVYVANYIGGTISVIDATSNTVLQTVATGFVAGPVSVALSPDGTQFDVTIQNGLTGLLQVYSTSSFALLGTASLGGRPTQVVLSPDGSRAYVAILTGGVVTVVSLTGTPTTLLNIPIPTGVPTGLALSPGGSRLFVTDQVQSVYAIDTASNSVIATIPVGLEPVGVAVTPDGTRVYVANAFSDSVSVIGTATNTVIGTINGTTGAFAFGAFIQQGAVVTLSATPNPATAGLPVMLRATVSCGGATPPSGTVTFSSNGTALATGTLNNGVATASVLTPASGSLTVVASYSGSASCFAGLSVPLSIPLQQPGPVIYNLSIPVTGCGSTTPSNIPVLALQNVSVTAVPCSGSVFVGWTGGPCDKTTINPCSIPAGVPVTANFAP